MENSSLFSIDDLKIEARSVNKIISNFYDELINYYKIKWLSNHEKFDHDFDNSFEKSKLLLIQKAEFEDYIKNQKSCKLLQVSISFEVTDSNEVKKNILKLQVENQDSY
jgi:hypothetical protein